MCKTQCVLALAALYMGLAQSWDIAISQGDELVFYTNEYQTGTIRFKSQNLTALAYDEVHTTMLYVDKQSDNDALCGYNLLSTENKCFIKRNGSNIDSIAFDPATDTLFFTDTNEKSINSISLKPGSTMHVSLLIEMDDDRIPSDIAVDSCRGYIYWTNTGTRGDEYVTERKYMERARFDGSERKVLRQNQPVLSFAMDAQTQKIYYFRYFGYLSDSDLNGQLENSIILSDFDESKPKQLTVTNDNLYWVIRGVNYNTVWQIPKSAMSSDEQVKSKEISEFINEVPLGLAANYKIQDQIRGLQDCEVLRSLIPKINNNSLNIQMTAETEHTTVAELFCVHGTEVGETFVCKCTPGYIGERCDVSVCENYCWQGNCSFNRQGLPKCRCNLGYSGQRCEVYACHDFCLNDGDCSLNENSEPVCQCKRDYVGDKCEESVCLNYCIQGQCSFNQEGLPTCRCNAGYSGERCEVFACHGHCLNNGVCSLNEVDVPVCQCVGNYEGIRCEAVKAVNNVPTYNSARRKLTVGDLLSNWRQATSKRS